MSHLPLRFPLLNLSPRLLREFNLALRLLDLLLLLLDLAFLDCALSVDFDLGFDLGSLEAGYFARFLLLDLEGRLGFFVECETFNVVCEQT